MTIEIKQGDKVRVSKDAPRIYAHRNERGVVDVIDGNYAAVVSEDRLATNGMHLWRIVIPTKYLVKVDAEAKEVKFKVGDKVKVNLPRSIRHNTIGTVVFAYASGNAVNVDFDDDEPIYCDVDALELYTEPTAPKFKVGDRVRNVKSDLCGIALNIEHGIVEVGIPYDKEKHYWNTDIVELFEPTEQTEAEKIQNATASELRDLANHGISVGDEVKRRIKERDEKPNVSSITIPVEVDLTDSYWDAYAAALAKEVALKVANKQMNNHPEEIGAYAVSVAKAVVEGLKRK